MAPIWPEVNDTVAPRPDLDDEVEQHHHPDGNEDVDPGDGPKARQPARVVATSARPTCDGFEPVPLPPRPATTR